MIMVQSNKDIAHLLRCVAASYTLSGVNRFRIIAYEQASDVVEQFNREIYDVWQNGTLDSVSGIGENISKHLDEYFSKKGSDETYIMKQINHYPAGVYEMMKVPGIGVKRAYVFSKKFNIVDEKDAISKLLSVAEKGKIAPLDGFGKKSEAAVITSISAFLKNEEQPTRMPLATASALATEIMVHMKKNKNVKEIEALGSLRRRVATIGDIDLAVTCLEAHNEEVINHFLNYEGRIKTESKGDKKASMTVANGYDVDLRLANPSNFGPMLQYFTGSKAHNIILRDYGLKLGMSLNEFGILDKKTGKRHTFATETEFYKFLRLQYVPPEIREGTNEVEIASKFKIPQLVELSDIKGDLQIHSDYDLTSSHDIGRSSLDEIISKAKSLKYEFIAITDHNPAQKGNSPQTITEIMKKRYGYMETFRKKFNFFISCEVDILPNGEIALPKEALAYTDMILVSIHSSFTQPKPDMTKRIISALKNPKVKILAHPTARLLGKRSEIDADWEEIFKVCKNQNIAVEINAATARLDLPDDLVMQAKKMGLLFSMGTDSHDVSQMDNMQYGVSVARRGWLTKNDIINCMDYKNLQSWMNK